MDFGRLKAREKLGVPMYFLYYALFFSGISVYSNFFNMYFSSVGCSSAQIGFISAAGPVATILGQYVFGRITDRLRGRAKTLLLFSLYIISAAILLFYGRSSAFLFLCAISMLYTFFNSPIQQLSDAATLDYCAAYGKSYNHIRMGGTVGYAVMALLVGTVVSIGGMNSIFACCIAVWLLSGALSLILPTSYARRAPEPSEKSSEPDGEKLPYYKLFTPGMTVIFITNLLVYIPIAYYISFFTIYLRDAAGGDTSVVGWVMLIAVLCEIPFLLFAAKIEKKLGTTAIICISCVGMFVRWGAYSLAESVPLLLAASCLHGMTNITMLYCSVTYIRRSVHPSLRASGQTTLGIITYGISRVVGNLIGGQLTDTLGIGGVFRLFSFIPLIAAAFYLTANLIIRRKASAQHD